MQTTMLYLAQILPKNIGVQTSQNWTNPVLFYEYDDYKASTYRVKKFDEFLADIPRFNFKNESHFFFHHILIPHAPFTFLRDGTQYADFEFNETQGDVWNDDIFAVQRQYQRHLLQLQYADTLLGNFLDTLKSQNILDESLIMVTADHGASFLPNLPRRGLDLNTYTNIIQIPMFVKLPNENKPTVHHDTFRQIDILPTLSNQMGIDKPWGLEGRDLFSSIDSSPSKIIVNTNKKNETYSAITLNKDRLQKAVLS
jgi:arylsulfatase A-like enzyme